MVVLCAIMERRVDSLYGFCFYEDSKSLELSILFNEGEKRYAYTGIEPEKLGDRETGLVMGRFLSFGRLVGRIVGVDLETYMRGFIGEWHYEYLGRSLVCSEKPLDYWIEKARVALNGAEPLRDDKEFDGKKIYFPSRELIEGIVVIKDLKPSISRPFSRGIIDDRKVGGKEGLSKSHLD